MGVKQIKSTITAFKGMMGDDELYKCSKLKMSVMVRANKRPLGADLADIPVRIQS